VIDVLVADPPRKFGDNTPKGRSAQYKRMPLERIMGLQLPPLGNNAVLFLWRCAAMQLEALQVAIAWGFVPTADLVWRKLTKNGLEHFGSGYYTRGSVETCVICVRGACRPAVRDQRNSFAAKMPYRNGRPWHSAKPDEFYAIVERMYPRARRHELFARTRREGWWQHGNQLGDAGAR
jgi:N6-adenosine-specific RNA methylase IME4